MAVLADQVDGVIGVDTHRDTLTAVVTAVGGLLGQLVVAADAAGYQRLLGLRPRLCAWPPGALRSRVRAATAPG
jgi:hypothetical protein